MKNFACLVALLVACSRTESPTSGPAVAAPTVAPAVTAPPTAVPPATAPGVAFVAWTPYGGDSGDKVRFFEARGSTIVHTKTTTLPAKDGVVSTINEVAWHGGDVIVRYDDHRVGRITARGFEELPAVPAGTWSTKRPAGTHKLDERWSLRVSEAGVFLGHCRWGTKGNDDQDECTHTEHARVFPGPVALVEPGAPPAMPAITPTKTTVTSLEVDNAVVLACTRDGKTIEIPGKDDPNRMYGMGSDLEWVSAEPAVFRVTAYSEGDPTSERIAVFENCALSDYADATRSAHGVFALLGGLDRPTSIRTATGEIGSVPESHVTFAP